MNKKALIILSWFIGILFAVFLFITVVFLGFAFFDCNVEFFLYGVRRAVELTGGWS